VGGGEIVCVASGVGVAGSAVLVVNSSVGCTADGDETPVKTSSGGWEHVKSSKTAARGNTLQNIVIFSNMVSASVC
jgi:hypothetical protein